MKLLIATSFFPSSSNDKVPQFVLEQVQAFKKEMPDLDILIVSAGREGDDEDKNLPEGIRVKRFNYFFRKKWQNLTNKGILPAIRESFWNLILLPFLFVFEFLSVHREIKSFKPDQVYSHWFLPQGLICHFLCKWYSIPHVFTSHSSDVEICKKIPLIGKSLVRSAMMNLSKGTAVSNRTLASIESFFTYAEWKSISNKFKVLPMGVADFKLDYENYKKNRPNVEILYMGRFVEKKGIDVLLTAFSKLVCERSDLRLTLAGDGPEKDRLMNMALELKLNSFVSFPGFVSGVDKIKVMSESDIFILPSVISEDGDREGMPVSLLENLNFGNICIATVGSGAEEIIENEVNGFLCEPGSAEDLSIVLKKCLTLSEDKKMEIRKTSIALAKDFNWKSISERHISHFFSS